VGATEEDKFKLAFKYYKRKQPPPSLCDVIVPGRTKEGVRRLEYQENASIENMTSSSEDMTGLGSGAPHRVHTWEVYAFDSHPGLALVRNPFPAAAQSVWLSRCLARFPDGTNNLSNLQKGSSAAEGGLVGDPAQAKTWWQRVQEERDGVESSLCRRLRWATLGYHHDWDTKRYSEAARSAMPACVAGLCSSIVCALHRHYLHQPLPSGFTAEAAIVNYYPPGATLSPHTDHSEPNMAAPLLSLSLGESCVFLIGGERRSAAPAALLLRSGDVLLMGGAARRCFHAVPLVGGAAGRANGWERQAVAGLSSVNEIRTKKRDLNGLLKPESHDVQTAPGMDSTSSEAGSLPWLSPATWHAGCALSKEQVAQVHEYAARYRINLNVRQVNFANQHDLNDS